MGFNLSKGPVQSKSQANQEEVVEVLVDGHASLWRRRELRKQGIKSNNPNYYQQNHSVVGTFHTP
ncbi:hypothetical protein N9J65_04835 [Flavobacteriaceae bacterium]|nr:hypothetical protein [Flavobacteriaceae bacterium]